MENIIIQIKNDKQNCPICNEELDDSLNNLDEFTEFKEKFCVQCHKFFFIVCEYCNQKIYYKKNSDDIDLNYMNGINVKCPYASCGKYFYLTICPKCKKCQKISKLVKEGELIKCKYDKICGYEYLQVRCPIKDCKDISYFGKPKNFCNSPNGLLYNHKKQIIFQKVTCNYCIRPIVYLTFENRINRYFDSMKIICAYQDCQKIFNRIICTKCSEINIIEGGNYIMGHKIRCKRCGNHFGKILCPKCLKIIPISKRYFKSGTLVCSYTSCGKRSEIINCIHCRRMNVFNKKAPIQGQQIICGYKDCGKIFNEVYCPSCNELNPFSKGDFHFGTVYTCKYSFCLKKYQFLICPNCLSFSRKLESKEGKQYSCNKCNCLLSNWGCPFCHMTILDKDSKLTHGQMIRCPNCRKEYSMCRCYECQKLIFSEEGKYILGSSIKCISCNKTSVNIICPNPECNTKITFLDRLNDMEKGEKVKCEKCQREFEYEPKSSDMITENEIYYENLSILENIQGEAINFGESTVDENYLSIENIFIESDIYKNDKNKENIICKEKKKNSLCILCHCDTKESIFYPCGHRCACYRCALIYFEVNKKCPKCLKDSEAIVPKIYEPI